MPGKTVTPITPERRKQIVEEFGVQAGSDVAVVETGDPKVRCPACGDGRINVQADHATCLNCGNTQIPDEFVSAPTVYVKVVPEIDVELTREDVRFRMQCPACGSRKFTIKLVAARCLCHQCSNEDEAMKFFNPSGQEYVIPGGGEGNDL